MQAVGLPRYSNQLAKPRGPQPRLTDPKRHKKCGAINSAGRADSPISGLSAVCRDVELRATRRGDFSQLVVPMEDDGEADSQVSEVAGSLSWWMMKNLWHESVPDKKLRLSLVDTILLQDGHVLHWFFTSSKSGSVLKVQISCCCRSCNAVGVPKPGSPFGLSYGGINVLPYLVCVQNNVGS